MPRWLQGCPEIARQFPQKNKDLLFIVSYLDK